MSTILSQEPNIENVQKKVTEMLSAVHGFCIKNNINYFVIGGTLIGAVRHKGFIPWDDDIDICIPRADYERFLTIAHKLPFPYEVNHYGNDPDYIYPYAKVYDTSTTATEDFQIPFTRGVWIDVFPIDGTFSNKHARRLHFLVANKIKVILNLQQKSHPTEKTQKRKLIQQYKHALSNLIPRPALLKILNIVSTINRYEGSSIVANLFGRWGMKESCARNVFEEHTCLNFGKIIIRAPKKNHEWLSNVYGDYMTFPPLEQRKPEHLLKHLDLNSSYKPNKKT